MPEMCFKVELELSTPWHHVTPGSNRGNLCASGVEVMNRAKGAEVSPHPEMAV